MIVQTSPTLSSRSESICSLNFATRVGSVEQGSAKRSGDSVEVTKLRSLIQRQKHDHERLQTQLRQAQHAASKQAQEAEKLVSEVRTHQQATTRLSVTVSEKERELAALHSEIATLKERASKSQHSVGGMKEQLEKKTAEAAQWQEKVGKLERQIAVLSDKADETARQLETERNAHWRAQNNESGLREEAQTAAANAKKWSAKAHKVRCCRLLRRPYQVWTLTPLLWLCHYSSRSRCMHFNRRWRSSRRPSARRRPPHARHRLPPQRRWPLQSHRVAPRTTVLVQHVPTEVLPLLLAS